MRVRVRVRVCEAENRGACESAPPWSARLASAHACLCSQDCGRELFWRLKPSVSAKDAKRIKLWRFKKCQIHLRVPASSMMEVRSPRCALCRSPPQPDAAANHLPAATRTMRSAPAL